jgi:hypothetical protein
MQKPQQTGGENAADAATPRGSLRQVETRKMPEDKGTEKPAPPKAGATTGSKDKGKGDQKAAPAKNQGEPAASKVEKRSQTATGDTARTDAS